MFSPGGPTVNPPWQGPEGDQSLTGGRQGQGPQRCRLAEQTQNQLAQPQQWRPAVGKQADQQVGGRQGEEGIGPAAAGVAPGQAAQGAVPGSHGGGLLPEHGHITQAEVEALPTDRMAPVGALTAEQGRPPGQSSSEATGHRKTRRRFKQTAGPKARWQGSTEGLKERPISKGLALAAGLQGPAPDHLRPAVAKGKHCQGALRTEHLPGGAGGSPLQLNLAGEAPLPVIPTQETDAQVPAGRGLAAFTVDPQVDRLGRSDAFTDVQLHPGGRPTALEQQFHQGAMVQDPADGGSSSGEQHIGGTG